MENNKSERFETKYGYRILRTLNWNVKNVGWGKGTESEIVQHAADVLAASPAGSILRVFLTYGIEPYMVIRNAEDVAMYARRAA